jgi:hypothetical protein
MVFARVCDDCEDNKKIEGPSSGRFSLILKLQQVTYVLNA